MSKAKKWDMWVIISISLLGIYILFMLYPMIKLLVNSVRDEKTGALTLRYFERFFDKDQSQSFLFSLGLREELELVGLTGFDVSGKLCMRGDERINGIFGLLGRGLGGVGSDQGAFGLPFEVLDLSLDGIEIGLSCFTVGSGRREPTDRFVRHRRHGVSEHKPGREIVWAGRTERDG